MVSRGSVAQLSPLSGVEIRFNNVSLAAEIQLAGDGEDTKHELPTITNALKKAVRSLTTSSNRVTKHILRDVSGIFKPATMTLVLGHPGSGKSALMKLLSGRFPMVSNVTLDGEVTYNGISRGHVLKRLPQLATYVAQRDIHFPTLTVRETLEFAHACSGSQSSRASPADVTQQLGLENCQDTVVGDATLRRNYPLTGWTTPRQSLS